MQSFSDLKLKSVSGDDLHKQSLISRKTVLREGEWKGAAVQSCTNACMDARNCTWQIGIAAARGSEPKHLKRSICKRQGQPLYFFFATSQCPAEFSHLPCALLGWGTKPWHSPEMLNEEQQNRVAVSSQTQGAKQGGDKTRDCEECLSVQLTLQCGAWSVLCWVHVSAGCQWALPAFSLMEGEPGLTQSSWHTVVLHLHLPHSNLLVCVSTLQKI